MNILGLVVSKITSSAEVHSRTKSLDMDSIIVANVV